MQHLAGASQNTRSIDPSAPTLREAAFWLYVRQCLYNAVIRQRPLDIDFSMQLCPAPYSTQDSHTLAWLRLETAWSNQILWDTACVADFCFRGTGTQSKSAPRSHQWQELWEAIHMWLDSRPRSFDPTWSGPSMDGSVFPDIWFTADWHGKSKPSNFWFLYSLSKQSSHLSSLTWHVSYFSDTSRA
jgi:hypothetical protein